ncbi:MAG: ABC transporter permease [Bacillota bacterium]|nr:ABC transporter permease [Bacillota bacterium]
MLRKIKLIGFELKNSIFNLKVLTIVIVLPLLAVVLFNFAFKDFVSQDPVFKLGLVDKENSPTSSYLIEQLLQDEDITSLISFEKIDDENSISKVERGEINGVFKIPEDFTDSLINMKNNPIEIIYNKNDVLISYALNAVADSFSLYIEEVQRSISATYYTTSKIEDLKENTQKINNNISIIMIGEVFNRKMGIIKNELEDIPTTSSGIYFLVMIEILILSYVSLYFTYKFMKEKHLNRKIQTLGLKRGEIKIIKLISYLILINMQILIIFIPIYYLLMGDFVLKNVLYLNLISIVLFSLWFLISSFIKKPENFILISTLIIVFNNLLGGTLFPLALMPYNLKLLSQFTFNYWFGVEFLHMITGNTNMFILAVFLILSLTFLLISMRGDALDA